MVGTKDAIYVWRRNLISCSKTDNYLLNKRLEIILACQHKNRFQVKNLNKERNSCYFNDNAPMFPPWA